MRYRKPDTMKQPGNLTKRKGMLVSLLLLTLLFSFTLALLGCGGGSAANIEITQYRKGTKGLTLDFLKNAPPTEVFEGEVFPVFLHVTNKGSTTTEYFLTLTVESDILCEAASSSGSDSSGCKTYTDGGVHKEGQFTIQKSLINAFVEDTNSDFYLKARPVPERISNVPTTMLATLCFPYKTFFTQDICIEPDLFLPSEGVKQVCTMQDITFTGGQGAPVAVTKIEPTLYPTPEGNRMQVILTMMNADKGLVINPAGEDYVEKYCSQEGVSTSGSGGFRTDMLNRVRVSVNLPGIFDEPFICGNPDAEGIILLNADNDMVVCKSQGTIPDSVNTAFTTPLEIKVEYGYAISESKVMTVKSKTTLMDKGFG